MRIGVLGAGQLGRMLALAGYPLGLEFLFYDRDADACAGTVGELLVGEFNDVEKLEAFARQVDVVTVEFENIPISALQHVAQFVPVYPSADAIGVAQDRLVEKEFFQSIGIPTARFDAVDNAAELTDILAAHNETLVVKSRRFGYDGKGQMLLDPSSSVPDAWAALGSVPLIAEQHMSFRREVSIIAARNRQGDVRCYPLSVNQHESGILKRTTVAGHDALQARAESHVQRVLTELDYIGVVALEFFDVDGELIINEMAPRVHNTGHWTIEGASASQFENHLRAILGWPLGDTEARAACVMLNIIGNKPDPTPLLKLAGVHLHDYGKEPRPGRKLGHVTICDPSEQTTRSVEDIVAGRQ